MKGKGAKIIEFCFLKKFNKCSLGSNLRMTNTIFLSMFLHFPSSQTHYRGKSQKSKPNGGSSTSAFANEVADAFGGQSRSVPWMISSITCKQASKKKLKLIMPNLTLWMRAEITIGKGSRGEWEITVIGAGDGVEGLEGSRRWLQRLLLLLLHYTPRNGLHLCYTSVTERDCVCVCVWVGKKKFWKVLTCAFCVKFGFRSISLGWVRAGFLLGIALNFLGFWADPIRYMIICLYKIIKKKDNISWRFLYMQ